MRRDVFQAIADPNRRAIIDLLSKAPLTLNEVAAHFEVSRPAVSKHVKILTECGLIIMRPQGRERFCEVQLHPLSEVFDWTSHYRAFWNTRLDALGAFLDKEKASPSSLSPKKKKK